MTQLKLAIGALLLFFAVSSAGLAAYHRGQALRAIDRAEAAEGQVKAHEEANRILNEHLRKVEADRKYWAEQVQQLEQQEGGNEELNPYLRSVLELVR